jgi:hypothetical protein
MTFPFALSLSKGRSWFDELTTNGNMQQKLGWVERSETHHHLSFLRKQESKLS